MCNLNSIGVMKFVYHLTQHYNVPSFCVRKTFVSNLASALDGIQTQKWNIKQVIIFHTVILQRVWLVTGAKNICTQIDDRLISWSCGAFDKLVYDSYTTANGYLGRDCGTQNIEQCHHMFLNLVLPWKLHEAVVFVCKW